MKFTIITVCLNAENVIAKTLCSVAGQNFCDLEYIIWDGGSSDHTLEIIEKNRKRFEKKKIHLRVISQKDSGIYNAMNESTRLAIGNWILFLNAGDSLSDAGILSLVSKYCDDSKAVIYGNIIYNYKGIKEKKTADKICRIKERMPFCHQAVFTCRSVFQNFHFDESYPIAADYELYLKLYLAGYSFKHINYYISCFCTEGISFSQSYRREREFLKIRKNNHVISERKYILLQIPILKFLLIDMIKRIAGTKNVTLYKKWKRQNFMRYRRWKHQYSMRGGKTK